MEQFKALRELKKLKREVVAKRQEHIESVEFYTYIIDRLEKEIAKTTKKVVK